jgi:hypothetical protein
LLGLGVDPEHDAFIMRGDAFQAFARGGAGGFGFGAAIMYRVVFESNHELVWTWAVGLGALMSINGDDVVWGTAGVRGELSARLWNTVAFTAFAVTGPAAGLGARLPWGTPIGLAIDVGLP